MIQRIQSVYLFLIIIVVALGSYFLSIWTNESGESVYAIDRLYIFGAFSLSSILALVTIFLYKNRKLQFVVNRLNIILNFILLGFFVYWSLMVPGEMQISENGIGMFLPIISIVLLVMANKAIKKDEALVKSVDRLR
ncbi:DUF4293 domain-containing protein [Mesonia sp. MT50]|uniref:DUF4293 domain-containing protein n=1 Tax=Mesonia profundi TaxID=3070998 RepID=A0ABU1A1Z7_9FLAO|nr:DUF4293 domain-containing protein [Mesonia profundi]MDQ7917716.1 DUF4293 domain-containing protein [Mesonia profundi]